MGHMHACHGSEIGNISMQSLQITTASLLFLIKYVLVQYYSGFV
jgi:hypothetical protein